MTKTLDQTIGDNHRIDNTIGDDRNSSRDRSRGRTRERSLTPRRHDRRYHSPNLNLGTRKGLLLESQ